VKPIFAMLAMVFIFSIPAHAQAAGGSANTARSSGGGSAGAGGFSGSSGGRPAYTPTAQFKMAAISGSSTDFVPSAYLPFDQAVALGRTDFSTKPANVVEVAEANKNAKGPHPEHVIVQDSHGHLVQTPQ
jgi:hypothetical protein